MKLLLSCLAALQFAFFVGALGYLYLDNQKLARDKEDLLWRDVTVEERRDFGKARPVDQLALLKASQLTGMPFEVLLRARTKCENGGKGYEFGYRGKTQGIVENYEPHEWQAGEFARRFNSLIWAQVLGTQEGIELLDRASRIYTGADRKRAKEYANYLRGK